MSDFASKAKSNTGGQCTENLLGVRVCPPDNASGRSGAPFTEISSEFRFAERRLLVAISSGKREAGTKTRHIAEFSDFVVAGARFGHCLLKIPRRK